MSCSRFWLSAGLGFTGYCWASSSWVKVQEAAACHNCCHGPRRGLASCLMRTFLEKCLSAFWFLFFQGAKSSPDFGDGGEWRNLHYFFFYFRKKKNKPGQQLGQTCFIGVFLHFFLSLIQQWDVCSSQTWLVSKCLQCYFPWWSSGCSECLFMKNDPIAVFSQAQLKTNSWKLAVGDGFFAYGSPSACKTSMFSPPQWCQ